MSAQRILGPGLGLLCILALSGCGTTAGGDGGGNPLANIFAYGGTTVPPSLPDIALEDAPCPRVEVIQGRAATRAYAGGRTGSNQALRHQISVVDVSRECVALPDGTNQIRVGVLGRVLIGPQGGAGRYEAPLRIVVRTPSRTFENRVRRVSATVASGQTQADFVHVEEDLRLPLSVGSNFLIEVGIDG